MFIFAQKREMNKYSVVVMSCLVAMGLTSCKEKKQSDIIITKKVETKKVPVGTQEMSPSSWSNKIEWLGNTYSVSITRAADKELPQVKDETGRKYYDNKIELTIKREDGSVFLSKTFTKDQFSSYTNNSYGRNGALLGLAFDRADGNCLYFGAGVGSPDTMSDEYVPLTVVVDKSGRVIIKADTQLDTSNSSDDNSNEPVSDDEEDGV